MCTLDYIMDCKKCGTTINIRDNPSSFYFTNKSYKLEGPYCKICLEGQKILNGYEKSR